MAIRAVKLPDVGEGIAEAEITRWLVDVGDTVREGDPFVEVLTDKATVELPSPLSGVVDRLEAEPGESVAVGAPLLQLRDADAPPATDRSDSVNQPAAADPFAGLHTSTGAVASGRSGPTLAAPAVRRRAKTLGVDLATVTPSSPEGRVTHEDLDRHLLAAAPRTAGSHTSDTGDQIDNGGNGGDDVDDVEVRGLRRRIAEHMSESARRIAHFTYVEEVDVTELQRTRAAFADEARPGLLAHLMRAVVLAVAEHPGMNARYDDDRGVVHRHAAVHLGVAAQTDAGLVVPVVHHAERRSVVELDADLARLSEGARSGTVTLEELRGSTITISNLGTLGGLVSTPIINHPEVAIVGVNKIVERPVVRDGAVVVRSVMNLSCSFDHRVIDGWDAATFVRRLRELLETPALLYAS